MTKYLLIFRQSYSENTSQYGYGDFPDQIDYIAAVVEADTVRKAQNAAKKLFPKTRFGGMFSPMLVATDDRMAKYYTKPADKRLSLDRQVRHAEALRVLAANDGVEFIEQTLGKLLNPTR